MSNVAINIAAEFTGNKAFKQADMSVAKLERSVKKLGRSLGFTLSTAAIVAYGKASVKAFAADEAAAKRLSTAVTNLGYSLSTVKVEEFIKNTEASAGILDDKLRPAFQALLTTTGSLTQSQVLLNDAIQISRASGQDLATVAEDLAKGYVGITRGLKKYNTGLTQAELKSKSFNEILGILLKNSANAADEYLTTTAYKLDVLTVASENAKETIGKGLVDAFARIGGGTETKDAAHAIDSIAKAINAVTLGLGYAIGAINKFRQGYTNFLMDPFGTGMPTSRTNTNRSSSPAGTARRMAEQTKAEAAAKKRAAELVKAQQKNTAELKKQAALKKAGTVFDLEQIQLVAALKGKLSEEEKIRVEAQLALLNGNVKVAEELTQKILQAQDSSGNLAKFLAALPDARNPFQYLDAYLSYLAGKAAAIAVGTPFGQAPPSGNTSAGAAPSLPATNVPTMPSDGTISYNVLTGLSYNPNASQPVVNVTVQGSIVSQAELIDAIVDATQVRSLSGSPSQIGRIQGMFGG